MTSNLALFVVDVSQAWEDELKAEERGYDLKDDFFVRTYRREPYEPDNTQLYYPHGTPRAGFNAIVDTARIAKEYRIPVLAVNYYDGWSDGDELTCHSIRPYIDHEFTKRRLDAFGVPKITDAVKGCGFTDLMIFGYDRDDCVLSTIEGARRENFNVLTSEHIMLTRLKRNNPDSLKENEAKRVHSLEYFRRETTFFEELADVWNFLREHRCA